MPGVYLPSMRRHLTPSMVVSCLALFVALTGTSIAAISYATNSGAVDGKSANGNGVALKLVAGRLIATQATGDDAGRIATKYLDLDGYAKGTTDTFGQRVEVADDQAGAFAPLGQVAGLGTLSAQCTDQNRTPGDEDPSSTIVFANTSGAPVNYARTIGGSDASVTSLAPGTQASLVINGSNVFELHVERDGVDYLVDGVVRQDGRGTATGSCLVYGLTVVSQG